MALLPKVKLKTSVSFPADVDGRTGIKVIKQNGKYLFDLNYDDFGIVGSLPPADVPNTNALAYNTVTKSYVLIPASGGGIPDAPNDGALYGRKNADWAKALPLAGGALTGPLTLAADPAVALGAATKQYVDSRVVGAPRSYLAGLNISTPGASNVVTFQPGAATDSTNADMMVKPSAQSRNIANWTAPGSGGLLDVGSAGAVNTWYHFYVIKRSDTGVVDFCMSLSAAAPTFGSNIPAAYTLFRRIGSGRLNASAQWVKFIQDGDLFQWDATLPDVNVANPGGAAVLRAISVPPGIRVEAQLVTGFLITSATSAAADNPAGILLTDPSISDQGPNIVGAMTAVAYWGTNLTQAGVWARCMTNTAQQIRTRLYQGNANTTLYIGTTGWMDRRGKDA